MVSPPLNEPVRCVAVMGATATGKSALAMALAPALRGEIVSMDSRQVYRGFDIGTAKPPREDRAAVPHHLVDTLDPGETSSAGRHVADALRCIRAIASRGGVPFLVGGTGLYFRALFRGLGPIHIPRETQAEIRAAFSGRGTGELHAELARLDPVRAAAVNAGDRVRVTRALEIITFTGRPASEVLREARPPGDAPLYLKLVLSMPRERLRERIAGRTAALFDAGWADEVARLMAQGVTRDAPAMQSLGYAELSAAISAGHPAGACREAVVRRTQQYAKRQETFFRSETDAVWLDVSAGDITARARELVAAFLAAGRDVSGAQ